MSSSGYVRQRIAAATKRSSQPLLPGLAEKRLQRFRAERASQRSTERPRLVDFVHEISPDLDPPTHLSPYAEALETAVISSQSSEPKAAAGGLRLAFAAPPQHGKTELSLRAFLWWDRYFPGKRHAYVTYNQTRSESVAKEFLRIAEAYGFRPTGTLEEIQLAGGSKVRFTSIGGGLTGYPIDGCCIIDDPIKDAAGARSAAVRRDGIEGWKTVARTRRHPGTSYVAMATRWHIEDLTGYLIKNEGWRYINLKAIAEPKDTTDIDSVDGHVLSDPLKRQPGESLWPTRAGQPWRTPEFFTEERKDAYTWASMYQGSPRPAGGAVFHLEPVFYQELPKEGYRGAFGLDLAYTAKTHADWSICVEGVATESDGIREEIVGGKLVRKTIKVRTLYVTDVQRKQVDAPSFALTLKAKQTSRPTYKMRWYAGGTEKGSGDFMIRQGIKLKVLPPVGDKLVRAQRVAAAWNDSRVRLPDPTVIDAPWLVPFLDVVQNFTGVNDVRDDDVDALAALWDELDQSMVYGSDVKPVLL